MNPLIDRLTHTAADDKLIEQLADAVLDRQTHIHPQPGSGEDLYCLNLTSWLGERMGPILVRLREAERRLAAADEEAAGMRSVLDLLSDDEPCSLGVRGTCMQHGWTQGTTCPHGRAQVLIGASDVPAEAVAR